MDWLKATSYAETIDFPMKYGAFRLKIVPQKTNPFTLRFPSVLPSGKLK